MSAFNVVVTNIPCPRCAQTVQLRVQFKYGARYGFNYREGDTLKWGMNDHGHPGRARVVLRGYGERCPKCGVSGELFEIWLAHDLIERVVANSGRFQVDYDGIVLHVEE
jgi:hypothetical protein